MNYSIAFDLFVELGKLILEFGICWCVLMNGQRNILGLLGPEELIYSLFAYAYVCVCACIRVDVYISLIPALRLFCCSIVRDAKLSEARRIPRGSPQRNPLWFTVRGSSFNIRGSFEKDTDLTLCIVRDSFDCRTWKYGITFYQWAKFARLLLCVLRTLLDTRHVNSC